MQHGVKYSLSSSMMSSKGTGDTPRKAMCQRMFTHNNVVYYDTVVGIVSALHFVAEEIEACNGLLKDGWLLCLSGSARLCLWKREFQHLCALDICFFLLLLWGC